MATDKYVSIEFFFFPFFQFSHPSAPKGIANGLSRLTEIRRDILAHAVQLHIRWIQHIQREGK